MTGDYSLVVLVPVLNRPHRVKPLLASIFRTTPVPTRVLFITDPDDVAERHAVIPNLQRAGCPLRWVDILDVDGNYAAKINAGIARTQGPVTNGAMEGRKTETPLIFLGADDLLFHRGWFEAATAKLTAGIGVVGTNDLGSPRVMAGEHSTHSLVTPEYAALGTIDEPDKLLHEGYPHEYVDDEFIGTAKYRSAFVSASDSHVEHLHPNWGKAPIDDLYAAQRTRMRAGRGMFKQRERLWA